MEGPKGWIADYETGKQLGICCVYYPEGSTWNDAETVLYPNIATKRPGQQTLQELMDYDLSEFQKNNSTLSYENGEDIPLTHGRIAKLRYFYGVNKGSSEAVAYINESKIIAIVVLSSKTQKELNDALPLLREVLQTYSYMDIKFANSANPPK